MPGRTDLESLVYSMSVDLNKMSKDLAKANQATERAATNIEKRFARMNTNLKRGSADVSQVLVGAFGAVSFAQAVRTTADLADMWTRTGNKIAAAETPLLGVRNKQAELADLARETRSDYESTVDLYVRLSRAAESLGATERQRLQVVRTINQALIVAGASTQEAASVVLQLSQGLASGVLQGDELRSLRESSPIIAKAIADEFKTTIGGLKQLGAEGKLTSDRVFKAILAASADVQRQFELTVPTIQNGITNVRTSLAEYIGDASQSSGTSLKLAEALNFVADNFQEIADRSLEGAAIAIAIAGIVAVIQKFKTSILLASMEVRGLFGVMQVLTNPIVAGGILGIAAAFVILKNNVDGATIAAQDFAKLQSENVTALTNTRDAIDRVAEAYGRLGEGQRRAANETIRTLERRKTATKQEIEDAKRLVEFAEKYARVGKGGTNFANVQKDKAALPSQFRANAQDFSVNEARQLLARLEGEGRTLQASIDAAYANLADAQTREKPKTETTTSQTEAQIRAEQRRALALAERTAEQEDSLRFQLLDAAATRASAEGNERLAESIRDTIDEEKLYQSLIADGADEKLARYVAGSTQAAIAKQREETQALAIAERELDVQRELAYASGDARELRRLNLLQQEIDRTRELIGLGSSRPEAEAKAKSEVIDLERANLKGQIREAFGGGVRAALNDDLGQYIQNYFAERLANAMTNALGRIGDELFEILVPTKKGGGGLLGDLFKLGTSLIPGGSSGGSMNHRAGGGGVRAGNAYQVGEFGKELFVPGMDGAIIPHLVLAALKSPPKATQRGGDIVYEDHSQTTFTGTGEELAQFKAYEAQRRASEPARIVAIMTQARKDRKF